MENINWTKGIDQKTGKPVDYDPSQGHPDLFGRCQSDPGKPDQEGLSEPTGGNNYWPSSYSPRTKLLYIPALTACDDVDHRQGLGQEANRAGTPAGGAYKTDERYESDLTAVDPMTGEIKKNLHLPYPNYSGTLATAGGLVFLGLARRHGRGL